MRATSPLPKETVEHLCRNLSPEHQGVLCSGRTPVYAPDFVDAIRLQLRAFGQTHYDRAEAATFDTAEQLLGSYRYECETTLRKGEGFSYFGCYYDLRGDRVHRLAIFFSYPDERTWEVFGSLEGD